jgi:hypothetical protein
MREEDLEAITRQLLHQHPSARDLIEDVERVLAMLPDQGQWKVADATPAVFLLANDGPLFTLMLADDAVHLTSRPIDGEKIVCRLDWGERIHLRDTETWQQTQWTFRHEGEPDDDLAEWQQISGAVRIVPPGAIDQGEALARAIAHRAGWTVAIIEGQDIRRI